LPELDALSRLLTGHIDEYCTALHRAIEGAQEARTGFGGPHVARSFASLEATHVWLCRALDLWEEMMDHCHEHGVPAARG
jgi:hypothetical protein